MLGFLLPCTLDREQSACLVSLCAPWNTSKSDIWMCTHLCLNGESFWLISHLTTVWTLHTENITEVTKSMLIFLINIRKISIRVSENSELKPAINLPDWTRASIQFQRGFGMSLMQLDLCCGIISPWKECLQDQVMVQRFFMFTSIGKMLPDFKT